MLQTQKCVASWPTFSYHDLAITRNNGGGDIWDNAFHISAHTLRAIQAQDQAISLLIRVRAMEAAF